MRIRRCAVVFIELREDVEFSLESLLAGSAGVARKRFARVQAPHLSSAVDIDAAEYGLLESLSPNEWLEVKAVSAPSTEAMERLLAEGLLISDQGPHALHRERDQALRKGHWWAPAAVLHRLSRWQNLDSVKTMEENQMVTATDLRGKLGAPPPEVHERVSAEQRLALPRVEPDGFDALLHRRATCRNFDVANALGGEVLARMLQRVFAAQAQVRVCDDTTFLKKTSPSGGGLHATEAYLIVQKVEGIAPGLYHYHPVDHALEPLPAPDMPLAEFAKLALAGQHWFANAPVLVVLAPRFARSFWKYRHHAKAYRALILDSGHLSQTLYLSATDMGLGAFVTSAINEIDIEEAFGMDPLEESPLAICGFGWRAERMETTEFDPAGEVWEAGGEGDAPSPLPAA